MKQKLPSGPFRVAHIEDQSETGGLGGGWNAYELFMINGQGDLARVQYSPATTNELDNRPQINNWFNLRSIKGGADAVEIKLNRKRGATPLSARLLSINLNDRKLQP